MLKKINYILHNIPNTELNCFYKDLYGICAKGCELGDCNECKINHILRYFKIYLHYHKTSASMMEKAYKCISWFEFMEIKYNILKGE